MAEGTLLTICLFVLAFGSAYVGYSTGRAYTKEKIKDELTSYYRARKAKINKSIQSQNIKEALVYMVEDEEKDIFSNIDLD